MTYITTPVSRNAFLSGTMGFPSLSRACSISQAHSKVEIAMKSELYARYFPGQILRAHRTYHCDQHSAEKSRYCKKRKLTAGQIQMRRAYPNLTRSLAQIHPISQHNHSPLFGGSERGEILQAPGTILGRGQWT